MDDKDGRPRPSDVSCCLLAAVMLLPPASSLATEPAGPSMCALLKELIPEVRTYRPEGARAQLVMALAEKYEPEQLRPLWGRIDQLTTESCPKDREVMLGIVKTKSLSEALR